MKTYYNTLYAPDGAYVRDNSADSIEGVWRKCADMGSRWIFYPLAVVTDENGIIVQGDNNGYINTEQLVGMTEKEAGEYISKNCDIIEVAAMHEQITL